MATKNTNTSEKFIPIKNTIALVKKEGCFRIIVYCFMMIIISASTYIFFNPEILFKAYTEYEEQRHSMSFNYRMESTPTIQMYLDQLVLESGAARAFIVEMHNGKYNASGLSFNYGSLTYESTRDGVESVREDYSDFSLERFPFITMNYKTGYWYGNVDEMMHVDKKLALKLASNDSYFLAVSTIYGVKSEIGFIGVTYFKDDAFNGAVVDKILRKYSQKISPYLDGSNAFVNEK